MYAVGALMTNEKLQKKAGNMMNEGMTLPYRKVLEKLTDDKQPAAPREKIKK